MCQTKHCMERFSFFFTSQTAQGPFFVLFWLKDLLYFSARRRRPQQRIIAESSESSEEAEVGEVGLDGGNYLVYLGHRREDNGCPEGQVQDIYGYCRSESS